MFLKINYGYLSQIAWKQQAFKESTKSIFINLDILNFVLISSENFS